MTKERLRTLYPRILVLKDNEDLKKTIDRDMAYIQSFDDVLTRRAMYYRYVCGHTWQHVAYLMGNNQTPDSLRMQVYRDIKRMAAHERP